jgi:glycerophosphoryl diester phosphodiesterase
MTLNSGKKTWKVAHRGWHQSHIENTMEAFRAAYDIGCDMVEFDVQLSKDGIPVIFHDDDTQRLVGKKVDLCDLDWQEIQSLSLSLYDLNGVTQNGIVYRIPSLQDFLREFGKQAYYLELKIPRRKLEDATYFKLLGEACSRMVLASGPDPRTFLGSFHTGILRHLASQRNFSQLAGIFENYAQFQAVHSGEDLETAAAIRYYSVSWEIFQKHLEEFSSSPSALSNEDILIWNIQGEVQFRKAHAQGVAGIVTDDIETLLAMPEFS